MASMETENKAETETVSETEEIKEDLLACSICLENYSPTLHAFSARCGHLVCQICLSQLTKDNMRPSSLIRCPYCRKELRVDDYHRVNLSSKNAITANERRVVLNNINLIKRDTEKAMTILGNLLQNQKKLLKTIPQAVGKISAARYSDAIIDNAQITRRINELDNAEIRMHMSIQACERVLEKLSR